MIETVLKNRGNKMKTSIKVATLLPSLILIGIAFANSGIAHAEESEATEANCPMCVPEPPASNDPFLEESCVGPTLGSGEAAKLFCQGAPSANLGRYTIVMRKQECNTYTGCGPWMYIAPEANLSVRFDNGSGGNGTYVPAGFGGMLSVGTVTSGIQVHFTNDALGSFTSSVETGVLPSTTFNGRVSGYQNKPSNYTFGPNYGSVSGDSSQDRVYDTRYYERNDVVQLSRNCARFTQEVNTSADSRASWRRYQMGALVRY